MKIHNDQINVKLAHSVKKVLHKKANDRGLTLSAYITQLADDQKINNLVNHLETALGLLGSKVNHSKEGSLEYVNNLAIELIKLLEALPQNQTVLRSIKRAKHNQNN